MHVLLGGHDQLVVDHIVGSEAHAKEGAGGVEVGRHAVPCVDVLADALGCEISSYFSLQSFHFCFYSL